MPLKAVSISRDALSLIIESIRSVSHGTVTLIVQNSRLLEIERTDKIRVDSFGKLNLSSNPHAKGKPVQGTILDDRQIERLYSRLAEELKDLAFGQIILVIKDRSLVQIERIEKQRLTGLEGIYGDGI